MRKPNSRPRWSEMKQSLKIPRHQREAKLPWEAPKPAEEDPEALNRIKALMGHPNYREADKDPDFLHRDEARGVRLQVDYLKTELLLNEFGIDKTVAVFGGSRIVEPSEAKRHLDEVEARLAADPENEALQARLTAAKKIVKKSGYYDVAREFGRLVGNAGEGPEDARLTLMTGGGPGVMEAANRGVYDVGAKSIGLNIDLPSEQFPNPYITPELCFRFHYFGIRKIHFLNRACALVAFPGGYGTLDELFEALTLVQTRKIDPFPIILVGEKYWSHLVDFDYMVEEGVIDPEDAELFWYAETAEEIWESICDWHEAKGIALP